MCCKLLLGWTGAVTQQAHGAQCCKLHRDEARCHTRVCCSCRWALQGDLSPRGLKRLGRASALRPHAWSHRGPHASLAHVRCSSDLCTQAAVIWLAHHPCRQLLCCMKEFPWTPQYVSAAQKGVDEHRQHPQRQHMPTCMHSPQERAPTHQMFGKEHANVM